MILDKEQKNRSIVKGKSKRRKGARLISHWYWVNWLVRRYLSSCRASPPFGRYQIIPLNDRRTYVCTNWPMWNISSSRIHQRLWFDILDI